MHMYANDFYGRELKLLVVGYLRPEMKFTSVDTLIQCIRADIGIARRQLDQQDAYRVAPKGFWK
jgi:riboflavin kinase